MAEAEAKISEQEVTEAEGTGPSDVIGKDKSIAVEAVEEKNPEPEPSVMVTDGDQPEKGEGSHPEDVVQAGTAVPGGTEDPVAGIQDQVADEGNGVEIGGLPVGDVAGTSGLGKGMETQVDSGLAAVNGVEEIVAAPLTAQVGAAAGTKQPKRRGRPPKPIPEGALISTPKRRGRPPKKIETEAKEEAPAPVEEASVQPGEAQAPLPSPLSSSVPPRKRGRPVKSEGGKVTVKAVGTLGKKRGRKPKEGGSGKVKSPPGSKKRGRPRKIAAEAVDTSLATGQPALDGATALVPPKKRGRAKIKVAKAAPKGASLVEESAPAALQTVGKKRGRPKKEGGVAKPKVAVASSGKRGRPKSKPLVERRPEVEAIAVGDVSVPTSTLKKRGRPFGTKKSEKKNVEVSGGPKKGRGRPPKNAKPEGQKQEAGDAAPAEVDGEGAASPKKRGRPKKKPKAAVGLLASGRLTAGERVVALPAKKRGSAPLVGGEVEAAPQPAEEVVKPKGRGRPRKMSTGGKGAEVVVVLGQNAPSQKEEAKSEEVVGGEGEPSTRKRGRPSTKGKEKSDDAPEASKQRGGLPKASLVEVAGPTGEAPVPAKKRGRPSMKDSGNGASGAVPVPAEIEAPAKEKEEVVAPKKRGRPRAAIKEETPVEGPKKRGRPTLADKDKVPAPLSGKEAQKLVGVRLEVRWEKGVKGLLDGVEDGVWFPGTVKDYNRRSKLHHILYDDGDVEWEELAANSFRVLDGKEEQ